MTATLDRNTILAITDFGRGRLLASLDAAEKLVPGKVNEVLAWRPGPGRAHIGWQALHCAATHDRYLHKLVLKTEPAFPDLANNYGGGSTPVDVVPDLAHIREMLEKTIVPFRKALLEQDYSVVLTMPNGTTRTVGESFLLLAWHEAHHQGQIHLTLNMYKAAHGIA
jgi:DinB superfamily